MAKSVARRGHKTSPKIVDRAIVNRRARFDYVLGDELRVGLQLNGAEVKAARLGRASLRGSYVVPRRGKMPNHSELYLLNAQFTLQNNARTIDNTTTVDSRERKILATRQQIDRFITAKDSGFTIIPTKLLTTGRFIKLVIALGRGKKNYDKRASIREKDLRRENAKFVKRAR
ncbi:MAG: SsrA-binding protein [Candidatus Nanoperiomorbaceae bacterium]